MNKQQKTHLEVILASILVLVISVILVFTFQHTFPEKFRGLTDITANVITSVNVSPALPKPCNFTVYDGWNIVSFFCITTFEDIDSVTGNISSYSKVFTYRANDGSDPWKAYNPDLPSWVDQDLEYFSRLEGYYIYFTINDSDQIEFDGSKRVPSYIPIYTGWNLVGYPTNSSRNTSLATPTIDGSYNIIIEYNASSGTYRNYTPSGGTLDKVSPGQGYWINATNGDTWIISW